MTDDFRQTTDKKKEKNRVSLSFLSSSFFLRACFFLYTHTHALHYSLGVSRLLLRLSGGDFF